MNFISELLLPSLPGFQSGSTSLSSSGLSSSANRIVFIHFIYLIIVLINLGFRVMDVLKYPFPRDSKLALATLRVNVEET